ncbi:hypothetical protein GCM10009127_12360 [Alteraurantiacibacter aestuarii]
MKTQLLVGSAVALVMFAQPALAQDSASDTEAENSEQPKSGGLDTITVTAQRREESLQDAAIAINAATGTELERLGVADATALGKVAPALYVTSGGGANAGYFVRGVGNFTNNGYTNPAVAFNIDGVYIGRPSSTIASFLDVGVVEILKGPQGTLYGRNATGGAINVIPNKPRLGENSGSISAGYGNYNAFELTGILNASLTDNVAVRMAGTISDRDGYYSDGTNDAQDVAMRGQIFAELSDSVDVRLAVDYSTQKGIGPGTTVLGNYGFASPFQPGRNDLPVPGWNFIAAPADVSAPFTGLHAPQTLAFASSVAGAPLHSPFVGYAYPSRDDSYFGVNAEMNFDLGAVDLVVIPAYRRSELDNQFNGPPFKAAINKDKAEQYSIEARLSGSAGPVDWIAGMFYFDEQVVGVNSFNQFATVSHNSFDSQTESLALFGRTTFHLTDSLRLVGGIRYTDESRSLDASATATAGICLEEPVGRAPFCPQVPTLPVGLTLQDTLSQLDPSLFPLKPIAAFNPDGPDGVGQVFPYGPLVAPFTPGALLIITPNTINASDGDSQVTFRAAVEYDITPDSLLYASFENGFRAGGFNIARGQETYDPEFIDAFTIGSKNRFFDDRLELNVELFYWKYDGQQLAALGLDSDGNNAFYTRNVGKSTIKGVDIDFQFLATETTLFHGGVQYLDATYDSFLYNQVDLSDPEEDPLNFLRPVTGCTSTQIATGPTDPNRSFDIDCSGKQALNSPKWSANFGINQTVEIGDFLLIGTVDGRYRGSREVGFNYIPASRVGGDFSMDAALTFSDIDETWSLTAYIRNLTDEVITSLVQTGAGNVVASVYQPPRTYGLRARVTF